VRNIEPIVEERHYIVGTHHPDGVFFAYGPGIGAGKLIGQRKIMDVASTMLYSLGLAVPSDFEGVVPPAMFTEEYKITHPIIVGEATVNGERAGLTEQMDEKEKQQILDQLQMLGYME
jgi:hypothetical protein